MKIVTGYTGQDHITSNDIQSFNQGVLGEENCVLNVGSKFNAAILDSTHIRLSDGEGVMQGVHFRIQRGQTEDVTIDPGTSDKNRIDIVCALYEKDSTTGVESVSAAVVKGTEVSGTPTAPTIPSGDILGGDTTVYFPLYQLTFTGFSIAISKLFIVHGEQKEVDLDVQSYPRYLWQTTLALDTDDEAIGDYITLTKGRVYIVQMACVASVGYMLAGSTIDMHVLDGNDAVVCGHSEYKWHGWQGDWNSVGILDLRNASDDAVIHGRIVTHGDEEDGIATFNMAINILRL